MSTSSWWTDADVQRCYARFAAAAAREFERMSAEKMAWAVDSLQRESVAKALAMRPPTGSRWGRKNAQA